MFSGSVQPAIVSLFSSTGSDPLYLWSVKADSSLPADSFTCFLDDAKSTPTPPPPAVLISPHPVGPDTSGDGEDEFSERMGYSLTQTVMHIQSPSLTKTYIRCPPRGWARAHMGREGDLGLKHPWIHIQVRNMGRPWSFELGLVDQAGKEGVVRCSTFQNEPILKPCSPPLLHLPLAFPTASTTPLTSWCTITMYLPTLISHFSSLALLRNPQDDEEDVRLHEIELPSARFSHVSYVKVYATCRLKRIWFSEVDSSQRLPWEFELCAET
ncbi:hypothetical protein DFH94DRAFT_625728 [Russula ochroleuca]|uniref:CFA20 domain-containing protein n=1 Tax=Russula ochroleuca TaxID=152965 RepID=A0A9P5TC85_9AGAM|nr:hypothetical protein DFH94DRAFT_625728 [Russula ochroleuca]